MGVRLNRTVSYFTVGATGARLVLVQAGRGNMFNRCVQ